MHKTTDGFGLVRSADRAVLYSLLEDEGQLAEKPLAAEELEAKVDQLLDVASHAFSDGDQPLLPTMMLGRAHWLILYRISDFDANKDLAAMENRPLAESLKQAQGEPGRWLFEHLDWQAAQRRAEHRSLHRGS